MVKYIFSLMVFVVFFATSAVKADVCDSNWWKTATVNSLEALTTDQENLPNFCNVWQDTPLHLGVSVSQDADVISAFVSITNANVLAINVYEETPLSLALVRLSTANVLEQYARETYNNATRNATSSRTSGSLRHLRNRLIQATIEAREEMDKALDEQKIAETIYQTLLSRSQ